MVHRVRLCFILRYLQGLFSVFGLFVACRGVHFVLRYLGFAFTVFVYFIVKYWRLAFLGLVVVTRVLSTSY